MSLKELTMSAEKIWDNYVKIFIFTIWLILIILWNYKFPNALPSEDVFVGVCLYFFNRSLQRNLC
jgi:hypothetical protein